MLEPREADIPALFLVLVVLPLVAYILLGKWSEDAKKRERVSLLAQLAAEEAFREDSRTNAGVIPLVSSSNNTHHECARCFSPATTRCSKCKSVRYCSGKCQIMHWRQVHKKECHQLENSNSPNLVYRSNLVEQSIHNGNLLDDNISSRYIRCNTKPIATEKAPSDAIDYPSMSGVASAPTVCFETNPSQVSLSNRRTKEQRILRKSNREVSRREDGTAFYSSEDSYETGELDHVHAVSRSSMDDTFEYHSLHGNIIEPKINYGSSLNATDAHKIGTELCLNGGKLFKGGIILDDEPIERNRPSKATTVKEGLKGKKALPLPGSKISRPPKSRMVGSDENMCTEIESNETKTAKAKRSLHAEWSDGTKSKGIMKMMGLRKPAIPSRHDAPEVDGDRHKKIKMLFPYEQFLEVFQCEIFGLIPRGITNCGNSCYANAVLQCLTCTKPLIIFLLQRSHSRSCCAKYWCLICELEQHAMMLIEDGGPLSLSRILSHMRSTNIQIGDGSQEDAHEFLRLLVGSMQSICLDGLGGEGKVDPRLQETTFIQHTFGGSLRSKVKCLRCHHESERYENIMDLTLEIYGWVESLEDALTQFTTPEDLDGENKYRCGRCAGYVRARKQLSIHEAPNILTIVLKRFQEGRYGKINKWITFPDMLDMIPFMTGTNDMPPLYTLYGVVVHLDTLNASFSGHYISYVKDLQDNWFRIDDTEVQLVPMSQVMSEGAYILFYMRSWPRPQRASASKSSSRHCTPKVSKPGQSKLSNANEPSREKKTEFIMDYSNHAPCGFPMELSDATSSDWSLFTSSDEASFTTESTRDSFSIDEPISSSFNASHSRMSSNSRAQSRLVAEEKGFVSGSWLARQVSDFSKEQLGVDRTYSPCCKL